MEVPRLVVTVWVAVVGEGGGIRVVWGMRVGVEVGRVGVMLVVGRVRVMVGGGGCG